MAVENGSIQHIYGDSWDALPENLQNAMEQAHDLEQARIVLAAGALYQAMNPGESLQTDQSGFLRRRLVGLHLSELRLVAETAEKLASQLNIPPYAGRESNAVIAPLISLQPDTATSPEVPHIVAPTPVTIVEPLKTSPVPVATEAVSLSKSFEQPATATESEAKTTIGAREQKALVRIFGPDELPVIEKLSKEQATYIFQALSELYLANNNKKIAAIAQVERWKLHLEGVDDAQIASQIGTITATGISQGRTKLYEIIGRQNPSLDDYVQDSKVPLEVPFNEQPEVVLPKTPVAADAFPAAELVPENQAVVIQPERTIANEEISTPFERLKAEVDQLGDSLGMALREKRAVKQRLDVTNPDQKLQKDAHTALVTFSNKAHRLMSRNQLTLTNLELQVFDGLAGTSQDDKIRYPLATLVGMYHEQLTAANITITELLADTFAKINNASTTNANQS